MAYDGYLNVGGVELVSSQAAWYGSHGWAQVPGRVIRDTWPCPGLPQALGHMDGWTTPANDGAPWWHPGEPHSFDFGGLLIQEVAGLGPGVYRRALTELAGAGAVISRGRHTAPQITVTGVLVGRSCCAVAYGLRWLRSSLAQVADAPLRYLDCAPPNVDMDCPGAPRWDAVYAPYWRELRRVGLVSGVEVIERQGRSCGACGAAEFLRVQFQLAAGMPWAFRDSVPVVDDVRWPDEVVENCFTWVHVPDGQPCPPDVDECPPDDGCALDPFCSPTPPPPLPLPAQTPCSACTPFTQRKMVVQVPEGLVPPVGDAVPVLTLRAGGAPLKHVAVRFWGGVDSAGRDPCDALDPFHVSYLAAGSELVIDAASRRATVTCPGPNLSTRTSNAAPLLSGAAGRPFSYPVLTPGAWTLAVDVDGTASPSASLSLALVARES